MSAVAEVEARKAIQATTQVIDPGVFRAINELQAHIARGGRLNEDFSLIGGRSSPDLRKFNEEIQDLVSAVLGPAGRRNDWWRDLPAISRALTQLERIPGRIAQLAPFVQTGRFSDSIFAAPAQQTVNVQPGAVILQLPAGLTPADQRRLLNEASAAFWGALSDRTITAAARA
jgi:hypothetical protein